MTLLETISAPGALRVVLQPIVKITELQPEIVSFECLTRGPMGTNVERPDILFEYVRRKGATAHVDLLCLAGAFEQGLAAAEGRPLSLNVHASTLAARDDFDARLVELLELHEVSPRRATIEIVEHSPDFDGPRFLRAIERLRTRGHRIALDDVGTGHSNLKMILDCRPDYLKIDRYFVQQIETDTARQAAITSLVGVAASLDADVVVEGVETPEQLVQVRRLGVGLVQGYYFARPSIPTDIDTSPGSLPPLPALLGTGIG
ncbi:MAG: EAL domain-containing protein [Myxococcales bacterium]|nr:EAL domain-containing protein [Myxococcales bacterium]